MCSKVWRWAGFATSVLPLLLLTSCSDGGTAGPDLDGVAIVSVSAPGASTDIPRNGTVQLQASLQNAQGMAVTGAAVQWRSENVAVAQVSASGVVTGRSPGSTVITATAGGRTGQVTISVFEPVAPAAPTNLQATPISNSRIDLSWTAGGGLIGTFRIERASGASPPNSPGAPAVFEEVASLLPGLTAHSEPGLAPAQVYRYRARACNPFGCSDYTPEIAATTYATLLIETAALPSGVVGLPYHSILQASPGSGTTTWTVVSGALPAGVTLSAGGVLSGTPTTPGTSGFTLRAAGGGQTIDRAFSIDVTEVPLPPIIQSTTIPEATVGQPYSAQLQADRGDGNFTWVITNGSLPAGLALTPGGQITGTPTASGTFAFTVEVLSAGLTGTAVLSLRVVFPPVTITTSALAGGIRGEPYSQALQASGGDGVNFNWSVTSGQLPAGLSLGATNGVISGTPSSGGSFSFTVTVTSGGRTHSRAYAIDIVVPLVLENWNLPVALIGSEYSHAILATGGDGSGYSFEIVGGALPPAFVLGRSSGVISGTTSVAGTYFFTVEVRSGALITVRTYALTVSSVGVGGFNIAVVNASGAMPPAAFRTALNQALWKWESIITTNFPAFTMPGTLSSSFCQGHGSKLRLGEVIEDMVILLDVTAIDGAFGVLGRAGPCGYVLGTPLMFRSGSFVMDEADIARLAPDQLRAVAIHEIGHTLGIGTMWDIAGRTLITGKGEADPRFTGSTAVAAYQALGGLGMIPVENTGGSGTRDAHWRETTFDHEVMTGYLESSGVPMPLSAMTIASLADLGFTVNTSAAEAYTLPGAGLMAALADGEERIPLLADIVTEAHILILPGGAQRLIRPPGVTFP